MRKTASVQVLAEMTSLMSISTTRQLPEVGVFTFRGRVVLPDPKYVLISTYIAQAGVAPKKANIYSFGTLV